jgi:hypothetical protein
MSIVDDRIHLVGDQTRKERLWQTPGPSPTRGDAGIGAPTAGVPGGDSQARGSEGAFTRTGGGDQLWQARIDLVVSSGLSGDAARKSRQDANRAQCKASFDALLEKCRDELRPVLECSAEMLHEWGLEARVTETLHDEPARVPRSFDLTLRIDQFDARGPGKLTITATEECDFVRIKLTVGPSKMGCEVTEHVGTTITGDLCDALVGGLVATLVEQIFNQ